MKRWSICSLVAILTTLMSNLSLAQVELLKTTQLDNFPSASSLAFFKNNLYVLGDDAPDVLILNNKHEKIQDMELFAAEGKRIQKEEKADLESSALFSNKNENYLIGISSFSAENRNKVLVFDLSNPPFTLKILTVNNPFRNLGIEETNIEGAAFVNQKLLLSNRANNTHKTNYLIVVGFDREKGIDLGEAAKINLVLPQTKEVTGISGLDYIKEKDLLLFVASTENTADATSDGTIGDSYLGFISNISKKLHNQELKADSMISFSTATTNKKFYKLESIAVESVHGNELTLHLAADNDDGKSTLFKVYWKIDSQHE